MTANSIYATLGLSRNPFPPTPDAGSYFFTPRLEEDFAEIVHCIEARKGFVLLTGEVGLGKSTLVRRLLVNGANSSFVHALLDRRIASSQSEGDYSDFKTALQELTAHHGWGVPTYDVVGSGPDHQRVFNATVLVDGNAHGTGTAPSKKLAEQRAARMAFRALSSEDA